MSMLKKHLKQDGLTLIEVLVSIVILSIILTTFFSFFGQSLIFSGKNEEKLVAYNLASKTLKIVEKNFKNKLPSTQSAIEIISSATVCTNQQEELVSPTNLSICYYKENQKSYFPEITITKETTSFSVPTLFTINIKIYNSAKTNPNRKLLSETFGFMRGMP
jgi:prepilin-type N-terminal cleavage/methylation domain-containing protein